MSGTNAGILSEKSSGDRTNLLTLATSGNVASCLVAACWRWYV